MLDAIRNANFECIQRRCRLADVSETFICAQNKQIRNLGIPDFFRPYFNLTGTSSCKTVILRVFTGKCRLKLINWAYFNLIFQLRAILFPAINLRLIKLKYKGVGDRKKECQVMSLILGKMKHLICW